MSFTLCSHGRQEAPCSQLVSVCAETLTTESFQEGAEAKVSSTPSPTPALPWHLCISAPLNQEAFRKHHPYYLCWIISQQWPCLPHLNTVKLLAFHYRAKQHLGRNGQIMNEGGKRENPGFSTALKLCNVVTN